MKDLQVISLTRNKLKEALEENLYWKDNCSFVPFSKSKAQWLLKNERIENDDVCAILGFENKVLISFIYLIPDWINSANGVSKIYWSSRWWVEEKYKNTVLSAYTKRVSLEATKNQMIIKYLGLDTLAFYKKQPFTEFSKRTRYIFVFNIDDSLIISRAKFLKIASPLLKGITKMSHFLIAKINTSKTSTKLYHYEYVSNINNKDWGFIEKYTKGDLIPKSKAYINWQVDNNQYTIAEVNKQPYKCLISSISNKIYNINFFVNFNNKRIGFISALVRGNEFITRYLLCDTQNYQYCLDALMENFIKTKCTFLLTEDEILGEQISEKFLSVYKNKRQLVSLAHNDVDVNFENKKVYQQDGHFA